MTVLEGGTVFFGRESMKKRASDGLKPVFEMLNSRFSVVKIFRTAARQPSWREQDRQGQTRQDWQSRQDRPSWREQDRQGRTDRAGRAGRQDGLAARQPSWREQDRQENPEPPEHPEGKLQPTVRRVWDRRASLRSMSRRKPTARRMSAMPSR